jgi:hypothetical protein
MWKDEEMNKCCDGKDAGKYTEFKCVGEQKVAREWEDEMGWAGDWMLITIWRFHPCMSQWWRESTFDVVMQVDSGHDNRNQGKDKD